MRWFRGRGQQPNNGAARDDRVEAAEAALRELAKSVEGPGANAALLTNALSLLIAVPIGADRSSLIDTEFKRLLCIAVMPGATELLDVHLEIMRDAFENKELVDAIAGALAALFRDPTLESHLAAAEAASSCSGGTGKKDPFEELAVVCQQTASLTEGQKRCEELLRLRRLALHQAEMLLARPKRAAVQQAADAAERQRQLDAEQVAAADQFKAERAKPLEEESIGLEAEVTSLQERQKQLRMELESNGRELEGCRARQRAWLTQVDSWRQDLNEVKTSKTKSARELADEAAAVEQRRAECSGLCDAVQHLQSGVRDSMSSVDVEFQTAAQKAVTDISDTENMCRAELDAWLAAAVSVVERWRAEDARAVQTLDMMGVGNAGAEQELPTRRELPEVLAGLREAWKERISFGIVADARREEVETMLRELQPLVSGSGEAVPPVASGSQRQGLAESTGRQAARSSQNGKPPRLGEDVDVVGLRTDTMLLTPLTSPLGLSMNLGITSGSLAEEPEDTLMPPARSEAALV